jgi:hypothetical protein
VILGTARLVDEEHRDVITDRIGEAARRISTDQLIRRVVDA